MKKKQNNKRSLPRLRMVVGIIVFAVLGSTGWNLWQLHQQVEAKISALTKQKVDLIKDQEHLQTEIERLNEPSYIEQLAREQLGLVRRGEITITPKK